MTAITSPDQQAAIVLQRQHGAIAARQAYAAGLSNRQVLDRCDAGRWIRRTRGVYVVAGSPDTARQRAWVALLATHEAGGVLSHQTAAAAQGVLSWPVLPHVTVPRSASNQAVVAKVHRGLVPIVDRMHRDGMAITSPSRTIVDLAAMIDRPSLEEVVDDLFCRRLATSESVLAALHRSGTRRRGAALARAVVEIWRPEIEPGSVAEVRLLRQLADLGQPGIVTQHVVRTEAGAFVARLDVAVPERRVGLEYDSRRWHNPRGWERDERRYAHLRELGWAVEPVCKLDLLPGERRLADIVEAWARRSLAA